MLSTSLLKWTLARERGLSLPHGMMEMRQFQGRFHTGGEYTADYETQYQLTIESAWGNPVGQGWYESGEVAHVSVHSTAGIIIRRLFAGWSGDFVGTEASTLLTMDGPKAIIANWRAEYLRLYLLIAGVVALVGATVGIYVHRRRKSS